MAHITGRVLGRLVGEEMFKGICWNFLCAPFCSVTFLVGVVFPTPAPMIARSTNDMDSL